MKKIKIFALLTILSCSSISSFSTNADSLRCSPNPFVANTTISYYTATRDTLTINIYNRWGTIIYQPFIDSIINPGAYSFLFIGGSYPDGVYLLQLKNKSVNLRVMNITKSANAGILQLKNPVDIRIYPNPTTGLLTIPFDRLKKIIVTDLNGRILKSLTISTKTISLSDLENGTYIVTILSDKEQILSTQKILLIK
jgi:hypothetical protein